MTMKKTIYRLYLSIIATSAINLSMILFSIRRKPKQSFDSLGSKSSKLQKVNQKSPKIPNSQLEQFRKKNTIKVAIVEDKAYWVHNNAFYEAKVIDGEIDNSTAEKIDASNMSSSKIRMLMSVLDSIS